MQLLGVPMDQIQTAHRQAKPAPPGLVVAPHLVDVVTLFSGLRSQWRTASAGQSGSVFTGLDYSAIEVVQRQMGLTFPNQARTFERIRTMEMEALRAMNERH